MRITKFRIEDFRNIRLAESDAPPDFMVICGGNGCGKSAFLQALMTAKEHAGSSGGFQHDPRAVSAGATKAIISMTLSFSETERAFVRDHQWGDDCPAEDEVIVEVDKGGRGRVVRRSTPAHKLLSWYSCQYLNSPGFFDYFDAYRLAPKKQLSTWDTGFLTDAHAKQTLGAPGAAKFQFTKDYLALLVMRDLQQLQRAHREGKQSLQDSLKPIRKFFNSFFAPMTFKDVCIDTSPFQYIIGTPRGDIDIDDLSGGEKEVLNVFIRFHQLSPKGAVILFDEADAHLHPDLERRYLEVLRNLGSGNQIWLTTHSPEMMIAAGAESLYTILKEPASPGGNQFVKVSANETLHQVLSEVMGSRGLVSFNQRIVFIEGQESSTDREIYERLYPPATHNVSFVPAGNSATVRKTAERVNQLLTSAMPFQQYYCIVDGDIERPAPRSSEGESRDKRLFHLPVYHVENFLLDPAPVLEAARSMLGGNCPYQSWEDVQIVLKQIVMEDTHLKSLAAALFDARIAKIGNQLRDAFSQDGEIPDLKGVRPTFAHMLDEARDAMQAAIADGTWIRKCKGREVLRAFCGRHGLRYEHFRNCVITQLPSPPEGLANIMNRILQGSR